MLLGLTSLYKHTVVNKKGKHLREAKTLKAVKSIELGRTCELSDVFLSDSSTPLALHK